MSTYLIVLVLMTLSAAVGIPLAYGRARQGRWGFRPGPGVSTGDAPYRDAHVHAALPVGAPTSLRAAAALNGAWAMLTLLVFAPGGILFAMILSSWAPVPMLLFLAVSIDGFILPFVLLGASRRLLQREELDGARHAVTWSLIHHAAVFGAAALTAIITGRDGIALVVPTGIACAIGVGLTLLLDRALRVAREAPAA
ncbi:MAG: hypothetical protein KF901_08995 [Myxococcales bacterium]|nr:hypothetical protein [Myxococcales bacterium]